MFRGVVGRRKERWGHLESEITSHLGLKKKIHECLYKGETLDFVKMIVVKMYYRNVLRNRKSPNTKWKEQSCYLCACQGEEWPTGLGIKLKSPGSSSWFLIGSERHPHLHEIT